MTGSVPAMDRPSIVLAKALDSIVIEPASDEAASPMLVCNQCGDSLCLVEEGDTMRVLFNTALAHVCKG